MYKNIDALLWTNLPEKLTLIKTNKAEVMDEDIIHYLKTLPAPTKEKAKNYIKDVPGKIETRL